MALILRLIEKGIAIHYYKINKKSLDVTSINNLLPNTGKFIRPRYAVSFR